MKAKLQRIAPKQVDIAKLRFISLQEILKFDLVRSVLFKGDFTAKPEKHLLTTELEKLISVEYNFAKTSESKTSLVIDFMSLMRRINLSHVEIYFKRLCIQLTQYRMRQLCNRIN